MASKKQTAAAAASAPKAAQAAAQPKAAAVPAAPAAAEAPAVKAPKPPKPPAPTCTRTKKDGSPCTAKCKAGSETCVDHQPVLNRLTEAQQEAWHEWVAQQDAASVADLLGWHKVRDLIGEPVNVNPNHNEAKVAQAA